MPKSIKKLTGFLLDKKHIALFLLLVVLTTLVPLQFARADLQSIFEAAMRVVLFATDIIGGVVAIVLGVGQILTGVAPFIAATFLKTAIAFNQMNLIPGAGSDAVSVGFNYTRSLANMAFIIILAWAAFATILRRQSYDVRKILPKLLIIALLINFIPVIAGLILDTTGIITEHFLQASTNAVEIFVAKTPFAEAIRQFTGSEDDWKNLAPSKGTLTGMGVQATAGIIFNIFAFFILLAYALIFIIRIVAIWILIILAPLAWLGYIIPAGKRWWNMWWNQFILWSIIGIPLFFFLYLSGLVMGQTITADPGFSNIASHFGFWSGLLGTITVASLIGNLPFIAAFLILIIGLGISVSLAPRGASGLISGTKKAARWGGKIAAREVPARFFASEKAKEKLKEIRQRPLSPFSAKWREEFGEKGTMGKLGMVAGVPLMPLMQVGAREGLKYSAAQSREINNRVTQLRNTYGKDYESAAGAYSKIPLWDWQGKTAMGLYLSETKGAKALDKLTDEQKREIIKTTARYQPARLEDIVKHKSDLIEDPEVGQLIKNTMVSKGMEDDDVKKLMATMTPAEVGALKTDEAARKALIEKAAHKKAIDALSVSDIETLSDTTIDSEEFKEMVVRFKSWNFVRRLMDERGVDGATLQEKAQEIGLDKIAMSNAAFVRAPYAPGGRVYFDEFPDIEDGKAANERIKTAKRGMFSKEVVNKMVENIKKAEELTRAQERGEELRRRRTKQEEKKKKT